jgi:drug/metabolite transporter (DMT)-like permease
VLFRPEGLKSTKSRLKFFGGKLRFRWKGSKEEFEKGAFYMLLSAVTLSCFTLFAKFAIENTSYFLLIFLRFGIPLVLLVPYLLWSASSIKELFLLSNFKMQILRCGCLLVYQYSIFYYLMHSTLLDATVMQNTAPLFMPVLERIFFKHPFEKKVIFSIVISFVGVLCILQPDQSIFAKLSIAGFLAPLGQAGSQVLYGHQAKHENQKSNLFYLFFLCSLVSVIVFVVSKEFFGEVASFEHYSSLLWVNIICLGVASILNQLLRGEAYKHGKVSALAPFLYFSIIVSVILDWAIFHHLPNRLSLIGAILVVAGGWIQVYKTSSSSKRR